MSFLGWIIAGRRHGGSFGAGVRTIAIIVIIVYSGLRHVVAYNLQLSFSTKIFSNGFS